MSANERAAARATAHWLEALAAHLLLRSVRARRRRGLPRAQLFALGRVAAYAFSGYREGAALVDEALNPQIAVESRDGRLDL